MNSKTYAVKQEMIEGEEYWTKFLITADNIEDANELANNWAHYHGFLFREVTAELATQEEINRYEVHNEWC